MLTVTENAVSQIRDLTDSAQSPLGTGVRIASDAASGSLTMSLVDGPAADDTVLDTDGAKLFLDADANQILDDKTLDAAADPSSGQVQFVVAEQA